MKKKRTSLALKIVLIGVAAYAVVNLLRLQLDINGRAAENEDLRIQIERQKRENALLSDAIGAGEDGEYIETVARSELGLVSGGEIIFVDISN